MNGWAIVGIVFGSVLVLALFLSSPIINYTTVQKVTAKVTKSERVVSKSGESATYLIFTENEVFNNVDTLWHWKWNSSDFYNKIEAGKTYELTVYGYRIPFLSGYRNIISYQLK